MVFTAAVKHVTYIQRRTFTIKTFDGVLSPAFTALAPPFQTLSLGSLPDEYMRWIQRVLKRFRVLRRAESIDGINFNEIRNLM